MTPYEYLDIATNQWANSLSALAFYFTLVSGYLVVAFLVGDKLNRLQVTIVTGLFVFGAGTMIWATCSHAYHALVNKNLANQPVPSSIFRVRDGVPYWGAIWLVLVVAMCLVFMWNVRHKK